MRTMIPVLATTLGLVSCAAHSRSDAAPPPSEVIVLGMIHDSHVESDVYGIDDIQDIVRTIEPDFILTEIPPDRLDAALREFQTLGKVEEARVRRFPEYVDAIFPLTKEIGFDIVPCAAWTRPMADDRSAKLAEWKTSRVDDYAEMEAGMDWIEATLAREGLGEDPRDIHTDRYDEIVKEGLAPYNRLFNDDLGLGGWDNINAAHYALIAGALDEHRGEGKRFLVTFGAWHKYWFLEQLRAREDVRLRSLEEFLD